MSEEITQYKTIKPAEMYNRTAILALEKLRKNSHKPNLLSLELWELLSGLRVEIAELEHAVEAYKRNPGIESKNNLDLEVGDCNNYLSAIVALTDGYEILERGNNEAV